MMRRHRLSAELAANDAEACWVERGEALAAFHAMPTRATAHALAAATHRFLVAFLADPAEGRRMADEVLAKAERVANARSVDSSRPALRAVRGGRT